MKTIPLLPVCALLLVLQVNKPAPPNMPRTFTEVSGPGVAGTIKNYKAQKCTAGDIMIVPAGVPHTIGFEVTVPNDILRVVFDPHRVLKTVTSHDELLARLRAEAPEPPAA